MIARGHKIIGSIKNRSGHGIDLITRKGGKLFFWEVKGSTKDLLKLSADQARGAEYFVKSRLQRAAKWNISNGAKTKALNLFNEASATGVRGGIIHIPDVFSGSGSHIRFFPWMP
ncbi:MAG TPA: hypothetical protein PKD86_04595 [Gemmatales bacterium]|nr:hypothetical protein [Gemmatales bacterium]